jgi:menaquinone-9 beta-reductase
VGDAGLATDPLWGVGVSWAFQSGEWLADETASALVNGGDLDRALARYARRFRRELGLHHMLIANFSRAHEMRWWERAQCEAVARDPVLTRVFEEITSRRRSPVRLLDPRLAPHTVRALAAARAAR